MNAYTPEDANHRVWTLRLKSFVIQKRAGAQLMFLWCRYHNILRLVHQTIRGKSVGFDGIFSSLPHELVEIDLTGQDNSHSSQVLTENGVGVLWRDWFKQQQVRSVLLFCCHVPVQSSVQIRWPQNETYNKTAVGNTLDSLHPEYMLQSTCILTCIQHARHTCIHTL